jgi:hypothetical protein
LSSALTNTNQALNSTVIEGSNYSFLRYATVGVVFLGTPFWGTPAHRKAQWLIAYGKVIDEKTSTTLIKDLDKSSGVLDDLVCEFAQSAHRDTYRLPIHCFFKTKATNLSKKVLPKPLSKHLKIKEFMSYKGLLSIILLFTYRIFSWLIGSLPVLLDLERTR